MRSLSYTIITALLLTACATQPQPGVMTDDLVRMIEELGARSLVSSPYVVAKKTLPRTREEAFSCVKEGDAINIDDVPAIDISFIEADIAEALLELSMLTEVPIIADETVQGLVSVTLLNSPIEATLEAILAPGNFAFKKHPGFIFVGSQYVDSPSLALLSDTCRFKPQNLETVKLIELLSPVHRSFVNSNEETNLISITAPPATLHRIQNALLLMDRPRAQVLLEVSIVEVSREASDILGVHWGNINLVELGMELAVLDRMFDRGSRGGQNNYNYASPSNVRRISMERFKDSIGILRNSGHADIKAMPSIITLDGREANFSPTETVWLPYIAGTGANRGKELEYGVRVKIVPHVGGNGKIRLDIIHASVSDLTTTANGEPLMISHSISSTVEVSSGEVLVLGGLLQKRRRQGNARVPGLSRLPGVKRLFSQQRKETKETEVLIVIHPTVVS